MFGYELFAALAVGISSSAAAILAGVLSWREAYTIMGAATISSGPKSGHLWDETQPREGPGFHDYTHMTTPKKHGAQGAKYGRVQIKSLRVLEIMWGSVHECSIAVLVNNRLDHSTHQVHRGRGPKQITGLVQTRRGVAASPSATRHFVALHSAILVRDKRHETRHRGNEYVSEGRWEGGVPESVLARLGASR